MDGGATDPAAAVDWQSLHRRVVTRWRIDTLGIGLVVVGTLAALELLLRAQEQLDGWPRAVAPGAVAVLTLAVAVIWPPIAHRHWSYRLADDALEIRRGVIVQRRSAVPYGRVQQVDLSRGPLDRMLGLTSAELTTAAATSDGSIPGLTPDDAERFRRQVLERTGRDDGV